MKLIRGTMWTTIEFTHETENFQQEFESGLKQFTGVRVDGYQFSPAYKRGVWDGYTHFYDEKLHRIPTGIANLAMEFVKRTQLRYPNLEIDVINEYPEAFIAPEDFPEEITFKDGDDTWPLRDYQYNSVREGVLNDTGIINLATNAGKTGTSVGFIKTLYPYLERGEKIAYIVPSKAIFDQAVATMTNNFGEKAVGYMGDGKRRISDINVILMPSLVSGLKDPTNEVKLTGKNRANQLFVEEVLPVLDGRSNLRTMITNFLRNYRNAQKMTQAREEIVESLEYMLAQNLSDKQIQLQLNNEKVRFQKLMRSKVKDKYDKWEETKQLVADTKVVIVDEGHHSKADTYYNTLLQFENAQYRFAMSGSVDKSDKLTWRRLQALYGDEVYQVSNDEMIERGVSAKPYIRFLNIRKQVLVDNPKNYLEVYDKAIVKNEERNTYIADFTKSFYDTGKKILIIVNRVEHGELIMEMLEKRGVVAEFINGGVKTEGRQRQLDDIKTGKLRVLIATGVLDEGFDVKGGLDMLVMAGSGKSFRLILQRVGRALRKRANGENTSVVLDFYDRQQEMTFKHSQEREDIYNNEGFDVSFLN